MLKIFNKIRKKLVSDKPSFERTSNYLKYAIGEIVLVVIGILIALQVNNWNERKKEEAKTKLLIEQVYSAIKRDNDALISNKIFYNDQLKDCNILLKKSDSLNDQQLLELLYYIDTSPNDIFEADKFAEELNFESIDKKHIQLVAQIKNFLNGNLYKQTLKTERLRKEYISPILRKNGITEIISSFGYSSYFNFNQFTGMFSEDDLKKVRQLVNSGVFQNLIESVQNRIIGRMGLVDNVIPDANYLMGEIKKEFPKLRLMFDNVGIIGTSLPTGYEKSIPMKLKDEYQSIWELDAKLSKGNLKFRARNSWTQNWGGNTFPTGYAQSFGKNIYVKDSGIYHIELNLTNNTYDFKKITLPNEHN